jgi:hypothetical protein
MFGVTLATSQGFGTLVLDQPWREAAAFSLTYAAAFTLFMGLARYLRNRSR